MNSTIYINTPLYWQFGFQDPTTLVMEGTINFHHDLFFFLVAILIFSNIFIFINMYKKLIYLKFNKQIINIYFFNDYNNQNKSNNIVKNKNIGGSLPLPNPNDKEKTKKKSSKKKYRKRDIFLTIATTIVFGVLIYIFFKGSGGDNPSDLGSSSSVLPDGSQKQVTINKTTEAVSIIGSAALTIISHHFTVINGIENTSLIQDSINFLANMGSEHFFKMKSSDVNISNQATKEFKVFINLLQNNLDIENVKKIREQMIYINQTNQEINYIFNSINRANFSSSNSYRIALSSELAWNLQDEYESYRAILKQICIEKIDKEFFDKVCQLAKTISENIDGAVQSGVASTLSEDSIRLQELKKHTEFMNILENNVDPKIFKQIKIEINILITEILMNNYINDIFNNINIRDFSSIESYRTRLISILSEDLIEHMRVKKTKELTENEYEIYINVLKQVCTTKMDAKLFDEVNQFALNNSENIQFFGDLDNFETSEN